jgi:hypothetical protein
VQCDKSSPNEQCFRKQDAGGQPYQPAPGVPTPAPDVRRRRRYWC